MAHLIDKDVVMSVIDKELSYYKDLESRGLLSKEGTAAFRVVRILKSEINSLEVKEADLEKEIKKVQSDYKTIDEYEGYFATIYASDIELIAKHFFELGLNTSNPLTWKDMKDIHDLYDEVTSMDYCSDIYEEMLKRYKAQKGE